MSTAFELRFKTTELESLAQRYSYPGEKELIDNLIPQIRKRGYLHHDDLKELATWKSPRIGHLIDRNTPEDIEELTRLALTATTEKGRVGILRVLSGVAWPMASVILHFCHEDHYPILDFRALWSLKSAPQASYSMDFWNTYTKTCRELAKSNSISMRDLDRALWQYSKENQLPDTKS